MSEFDAGGAKGDKFLCAVVKCCDFSFSCGADYHLEDSGDYHDRGVDDLGVYAVVAKVDVAASTAACFWCNKIGGVTVAFEYHVASIICDTGVGMCGGIVEEAINGLGCGHCACSYLGGEIVEGMHHSRVDGTGVIEEAATNFLEAFYLFVGEGRGRDYRGHLLVLAVDWCSVRGSRVSRGF